MKNLFTYLNLLLLSLILTNCSSSLFMLDPDENASFEMGRKVVEKEDSRAYSSVSFEEQSNNSFIFYIFVHNKEQDNFLFDPADIHLKNFDKEKNLIFGEENYAFDPEEQINELNKSIDEREDVHDAVTGLNIVFSLFDTIVDLNDDEDNNTEEVLENIAIFTDNQINEEIDYESDIDYLKASRAHWKNDVLRKTDLESKENVEGIIYVPFNPDAAYVKLYLPIGNTTHIYKFKQVEIN
ncbi:MAG: hypothetical protein R3250_09875 [Melioribacteraceae bacterium]|nr:hypothetical protein [Melioribacteraceae bacterium]